MTHSKKHSPFKQALIASAVAGILGISPIATAQNDITQVKINSQPLAESLFQISDVYGISIFADENLVDGINAKQISGTFTIEEALDILLVGTGLLAVKEPNGAYVIVERQRQSQRDQRVNANRLAIEKDVEIIKVTGTFQQSLIDRIPLQPQELPFTLNVLDRDIINERNFVTPFDTVLLIPNINQLRDRIGFGGGEFTIRGYTGNALKDNRALLQTNGSGRPDDSFVDRFEVLKGPASIALGPVEPGGIVNVVTKSPESDRFMELEITTDQFGTVETEFDFNAGYVIGDSVRARFSGAYRDFEFDADPTQSETIAIRGVVDVEITPLTFAKASIAYQDIQTVPNGLFPLNSDGSIPDGFDTDTFFGKANARNNAEDLFIEGQVVHQFLDDLKLVVRGSHQVSDFSYDDFFPGIYNYTYSDGSAGIGLDNQVFYQYFGYDSLAEADSLFLDSQLSLSFEAFGQENDFVIGTSYYDFSTDFFSRPNEAFVSSFLISDINVPRFSPENTEPQEFENSESTELKSVYAEFAIRPTEWLTVIGGVRYDDLMQDTFIPADETDVTFRIGASAEFIDGFNVYLSVAQSFAPQFGQTVEGEQVPPARGNSYEAGLKGILMNGAINFDFTIFDTRRTDVAVQDIENSVPGTDQLFQTSIGEQRNRGIEFSALVRPLNGLTFDINYGYIEIDVLEASDAFGLPVQVPDHTFNLYGNYEIQQGLLAGLQFGGGMRHASERPITQSVIPDLTFPDYTIFDVRVAYPITPSLSLSLNAINVTDELYLKNAGFDIGFITGGNGFGEPRTFRVTIRGTF